jgi:hypothetical protein
MGSGRVGPGGRDRDGPSPRTNPLDPYDRDGGEDEQQPQAGSVPVGIVTGAVGILAESLRPLIDYGYLMLAPSATDKTDPPR